MTRSLFDWQLPGGVSIEQSFSSRPAENGYHLTWENRFTAVCDACGARTRLLAARADAIDDLEGHACSEMCGHRAAAMDVDGWGYVDCDLLAAHAGQHHFGDITHDDGRHRALGLVAS